MQLKISGRCGNQLFQYANVRAFKEKNNIKETLKISFELNPNKENGFDDNLKYFNVEKYEIIEKVKMNRLQKIVFQIYRLNRKIVRLLFYREYNKKQYVLIYRKLQKKWQKLLNFFGIYHYLYGYCNLKNSKSKNKIFEGYFESSQYFETIKKQIRKEFTPKELPLEKNKMLYKKMEDSNSVCVTIRRGDFLSSENKKDFYICTPEYFKKGIEIIKKYVKNPKFFIFSDDIDWVKQNMDFPDNTEYETGNDPVWEKLRLMYSCKHFIISNSTFSWWAQYLSRNENKIVVAPSIWNHIMPSEDIYEKEWKIIDIKKMEEIE